MNIVMLREVMQEKGFSVKRLAESVPMKSRIMKTRLWGMTEFTLWEIQRVSKILELDKKQMMHIFFGEKVS